MHLQNEPFVINRNLPGQRLGAKQWFLHLQAFLKERMDFQFSSQFGAGVLLPGRAPGVIAAHFVIVLVSIVLQVSASTKRSKVCLSRLFLNDMLVFPDSLIHDCGGPICQSCGFHSRQRRLLTSTLVYGATPLL